MSTSIWKVTGSFLPAGEKNVVDLLIRARREINLHTPRDMRNLLVVDIDACLAKLQGRRHIAVVDENNKAVALTGYQGAIDEEESIDNAFVFAVSKRLVNICKKFLPVMRRWLPANISANDYNDFQLLESLVSNAERVDVRAEEGEPA
jgi:hypothetical protein